MRLALAVLFVVGLQRARSLDGASACARPRRSARSSASALPAPCDLRHGYCTTPGSHYPWHAIRRFVRENQGLMRRMYGEERHIAVLKAEIENFIEDDDDDVMEAKSKYSKSHRAVEDKPHFRPIQGDKRRRANETLAVRPLAPRNGSALAEGSGDAADNISYKSKLESIANIEINNLEPDVIALEAVIRQSIEAESASTPLGHNDTSTESSVGDSTQAQPGEATTEAKAASTLPPTLLFSEHEKADRVDTKATDKEEQARPADGARPAVIKLRGANACESKEEMAAPFWANSTRGEVLALLNMYPFEQYIHLETCVHEHRQMYCREGCRCEQQYRIHRLLAYDPRNECRGIFADWFKFPACCVCKCYDVPLEFRARSPRLRRPRYGPALREVIARDVARDWDDLAADDLGDLGYY